MIDLPWRECWVKVNCNATHLIDWGNLGLHMLVFAPKGLVLSQPIRSLKQNHVIYLSNTEPTSPMVSIKYSQQTPLDQCVGPQYVQKRVLNSLEKSHHVVGAVLWMSTQQTQAWVISKL